MQISVEPFTVFAALVSVSAIFSFINYKFMKLPTTIGVMVSSLVLSMLLMAFGYFGVFTQIVEEGMLLVLGIDFNKTLMVGMLSFLLFAGALHVDINDLMEQRWRILTFATAGVLISTASVGFASYHLLRAFGMEIDLIYCLILGAILSPTDPIAVLGILKKAGVPKSLEVKIAGESLFNDGVGVVVFITLLGMANGNAELDATGIALLFIKEVIGGAGFGLFAGFITYRALREVDNYQVEILITLALVAGGYAIATSMHFSGPITIVMAGLFIGNHGRRFAMSQRTREHLDMFWQSVDELLNSILFVLIGLELLVISFRLEGLMIGLCMIPIVLIARAVSLGVPMRLLSAFKAFSRGALRVMTWGGLRGGISVALALSIPPGPERNVILQVTYVVVVFSIIVQGLTLRRVISHSCFDERELAARQHTTSI